MYTLDLAYGTNDDLGLPGSPGWSAPHRRTSRPAWTEPHLPLAAPVIDPHRSPRDRCLGVNISVDTL